MENYKIKVNDEQEFNEVSKLSSELGYVVNFSYSSASGESVKGLYLENGRVEWTHGESYFNCANLKELTLPQLRDLVAQSKNEQGLISGADALRALADGKEVEQWNGNIWWDVEGSYQIDVFRCGKYKFRLKPRTIKLSIEIPAPFEPKDGDTVWFLNDDDEDGYGSSRYNSGLTSYFGWWSTEEEIKQVVAVLRGGIKA